MPARNIFSRLGTTFMRNSPNSVAIQHDTATDQLKTLSADGSTVKTLNTQPAPANQSTASLTITAAMNGKTFTDTQGAATTTFTLPSAVTYPGFQVTFINGDAAGEILINPIANEQISIKGLVDHSTSVKPAAGTGVKNTAATNVLGDHLTLRSNGVCWNEVAGAGIWATQ